MYLPAAVVRGTMYFSQNRVLWNKAIIRVNISFYTFGEPPTDWGQSDWALHSWAFAGRWVQTSSNCWCPRCSSWPSTPSARTSAILKGENLFMLNSSYWSCSQPLTLSKISSQCSIHASGTPSTSKLCAHGHVAVLSNVLRRPRWSNSTITPVDVVRPMCKSVELKYSLKRYIRVNDNQSKKVILYLYNMDLLEKITGSRLQDDRAGMLMRFHKRIGQSEREQLEAIGQQIGRACGAVLR